MTETKIVSKSINYPKCKCRICGSEKIYTYVTTELAGHPWMSVHSAYCEKCAKDIELFELQLVNRRRAKE